MTQFALRWILMNEAVTVTIPGAKNADQARTKAVAADLPPLPGKTMAAVKAIYDERIAPCVDQRW